MALQHLRSGTANKRPIPTVMSAGQIAINTNEASPGLFFKDSNGDLVKVGPVHIGTSAPNSSPDSVAATALVTGTVYQILTTGTSDFTLVGASANTVGVIFTATGTTTGDGTVSGQQGVEKGEMWLDTTGGNYVLKIYDGTAWRSEAGEFVNVTGDTMTGDLVFNNADIVFEGATADEFETTLTVVDPTADRTITLPDTTGTVVTTGDTGTVTTTMIANGTSRQLLQTNLPGTGVEWTDDVAIPGDLLVVGAAAFTGVVDSDQRIYAPKFAAERGTASAPSFYFDLDTGIYSPGDNQFGITTGGTSRLVIDSSGNVNIKQALIFYRNDGTTIGSSAGNASKVINGGADGDFALKSETGNITFITSSGGGLERMTIDSTGKVGIGKTSMNRKFEIYDSTEPYIVLQNATTGTGSSDGFSIVEFGLDAYINNREAGAMRFWNNGSERMSIDSAGRLGIGTSSPGALLDLGTATPILRFSDTDTTGYHQIQSSNANFIINADPSNATANSSISFNVDGDERVRIDSSGNVGINATTFPANGTNLKTADGTIARHILEKTGTNARVFEIGVGGSFLNIYDATADSERMRIDSSGKVLLNTATSRTVGGSITAKLQIEGTGTGPDTTACSVVQNSNDATGPRFMLAKSRGTLNGSSTLVQSGDGLGMIDFSGADGSDASSSAVRISAVVDGTPGSNDMPGRLVFSTTADGASSPTERMRISSAGTVTLGGADPSSANSSADFFQIAGSGSASGSKFESKATSTSTRYHFLFTYSTSSIGSITTTSSSTAYNTVSDYRLKENVVDIVDGITRVKQLAPKRFNFIADADRTVDGFLAHEAQTVVPEAVTGEKDAVDNEGNPEYQGIDQSKLVPLLTAALQEAIAKIENLEASNAALETRLTALEGGS